ncbi:MAG: hypothetical protein IJY52_06010 [Anaerotignum sp.]|nr:hypothetical protein [Anaerotignum sp.]
MASIKAKQVLEIIIKILFFAFVLYLLWGIYIVNLGYDVEMQHTIHAGLYESEEKLEDATIEVEGTFRNYFFQRDTYEGRFAVSCLPETMSEYAIAHIHWSEDRYGVFPSIRYLDRNPDHKGLQFLDINGDYSINVLNKDMTEILWGTSDGKYIATETAYGKWLAERSS